MKHTLTKSKFGNQYLICPNLPQVLLVHPILTFLLCMKERRINLGNWYNQLKDTDTITIDEEKKLQQKSQKLVTITTTIFI